jgi:adenosylhomocysteinase
MEHMLTMKDGAILSNAGHFNVEIAMAALEQEALDKREARNNILGYQLTNDKWVYVIGDGRLVNIAAGDGHPAEIMDLSFAVQILSALYIKNHYQEIGPHVVDVSQDIDQLVSKRILQAWGVSIDTLTPDQEKYLNSWEV